ncbi:hypothetical protein FOA52_013776 [Chlamydomonas sp. UWO 241]|nr:hypothetical protein FOA52_013776 [Chlamydomonas sp. UWO 241]
MKAVQWTAHEFCRPGDVVHLVHVSRILSPHTTIQHSYVGSSYEVPDTRPVDEQQHADTVKEVIKSRFTSELDRNNIPYAIEMFLDTDNAPASAVCATLFKVADQVKAALIVMACHNKAYGWDTVRLGSVADFATSNSKLPVMLIRDYKMPLVIGASSTQGTADTSPEPAAAADSAAGATDAA